MMYGFILSMVMLRCFFPLGEDFTVVIKLDVQYDGDARNVFHMISIGWTSDGELVS